MRRNLPQEKVFTRRAALELTTTGGGVKEYREKSQLLLGLVNANSGPEAKSKCGRKRDSHINRGGCPLVKVVLGRANISFHKNSHLWAKCPATTVSN